MELKRNLNHPVWSVYDSLRTARLNVLVYEKKLLFTERLHSSMQILLAAVVPSSAVAGLEIWDFWLGQHAWEIAITFSSLVAFIQPFLGLSKKIKVYSELVDGYKILFYDLSHVKDEIEVDKDFSSKHRKLFKLSKERRKQLEIKETGVLVDEKLLNVCQRKVSSEYPASRFFVPSEEE